MPSVPITITTPALSAGQVFKVRFRALPAGVWVLVPDQTNAPFTIIGVAAGSYELEVRVQMAPNTEPCPPVVYPFTVKEAECPCLTGVSGIVYAYPGGTFGLSISYALPSPQPACGWVIVYGPPAGPFATVTYATLPAGPLLFPCTSPSIRYRIFANCCGKGGERLCHEQIIQSATVPPTPGACVDMDFNAPNTNAALSIFRASSGQWYIRIVAAVTGTSSPFTMCDNIFVAWSQKDVYAPAPPDSGSAYLSAASFVSGVALIPISPSYAAYLAQHPKYQVNVIDCCKKRYNFPSVIGTP